MGEEHADVRQHLFHGAHDAGKLSGVAEVRVHPEVREVEPGDPMPLTAVVVNAKAGHKVPSGSAEERLLWLHVEAKDAKGKVWPLRVDRKGFPGEEYTIADANGAGLSGHRRHPRASPGSRVCRATVSSPPATGSSGCRTSTSRGG